MEDLEKLLGEAPHDANAASSANHPLNSQENSTSASLQSSRWCPSCLRQARELEEKYSRNFIAIKQKIFFTDNLIQMYQKTKGQLEEVTVKFNQASKDKALKQAQLELLLSEEQPSTSEIEDLRSKNASFVEQVEDLKTKLHAMDESRKMHEESLKVLKAEDSGATKKLTQQILELKKELAEKTVEHKKLRKKCKRLEHRVEKLTKEQKKCDAERETDVSDAENAATLEQAVIAMTADDILVNSGEKSCEDVESTRNIQRNLQSTNQQPEPKDREKIAHITCALVTKETEDQICYNPTTGNLIEKEAKRSITEEFTEKEISELGVVAIKWKEIVSKKLGLNKQDVIDALLKNISEFCLRHKKESRNFVLKKFLDLHKGLYPIRHRRWITDLLKEKDVLIKQSSSPDVLNHVSHIDEIGLMSSTDDSEIAELGPMNSAAEVVPDRNHVSVMPDICNGSDVSVKLKDIAAIWRDRSSHVSLAGTSEAKQNTTDDLEEVTTTEHPTELNERVADVTPCASQKSNCKSMDKESKFNDEEVEEIFIAQPTEAQLLHLKSIAAKWRVVVCHRPSRRKQDIIEELLLNISQFCLKHDIKSKKIVLEKFYDLHQNMYSKKCCQWIKDLISKEDSAMEESSLPMAISSIPDSAIEDKVFEKDGPLNNTDRSFHAADMKNQESVNSRDDAFRSFSLISSKATVEQIPKIQPASEGDALLKQNCSNTIGHEAEVFPERSITHRKHQSSEDPDKFSKKQEVESLQLSGIVSRRRTRSMRASSSSEQDDAMELLPNQRKRRRHSSVSSSKKKLIRPNPDAKDIVPKDENKAKVIRSDLKQIRKATEINSSSSDVAFEKNSFNGSANTKKIVNTSVIDVSKKHLRLSSDTEKTDMMVTEERTTSTTCKSLSGCVQIHSTKVSSPTELLDVMDIFNEMLPSDVTYLSPLPNSPPDSEREDPEELSTASNRQHELTVPNNVVTPLPDDHKGRDSISPSTDLCTVLNFGTPKKSLSQKNSKTEDLSKTSSVQTQKVVPVHESLECVSGHTVTDDVNVSDSCTQPESPLIHQSSITKDILKPRRFSCEAPEKAVSVPPIKASSTVKSFERIRSPLVVKSGKDCGQSSSFPPLRKEGDIPSHWHQSSSHSKEDKSDVGKQLLLSDEETPLQLSQDEMDADEENGCSDYDVDLVMKDMTKPCPLLSAIENEADLNDLTKSGKISDKSVPASSPKAHPEEAMISSVKVVESEGTTNDAVINKDHAECSASSADEKSLIMDLSDDAVSEHGVATHCLSSQDMKRVESIRENGASESFHSLQKVINVASVTSGTPEDKNDTFSDTGRIAEEDQLHCVTTFGDLRQVLQRKEGNKCIKVIVKDTFIAEGVYSIFEQTKTEFDLFAAEGANSDKFEIKDLPHSERKFLHVLHLIHSFGLVEGNFLTKTVIPVLLKIHDKLGHSYSDLKKLSGEDEDACFAKLHLFFSRVKSALGVSLPRMLAFMRVFVFICKMVETVSPIVAVCRYHLLWTRDTKLIVSLIQGLMCWPTALKHQPVLGQTVLRVLRKSVGSSQMLSRKAQAVLLGKQLDWIDNQCCWRTTMAHSAYSLSEVKSTISDAIGRIEAATFSTELKGFLDSEDKPQGVELEIIPIFDQDTTIGFRILEFLPKESVVDDVKCQIIDKQFWPLLNAWSQHLHIHGDVDENRKVSNACAVAILHSFSQILSAYLLRQKHMHKDQPTVPKLQSHYKVICSLMDNLATLYLSNAPKLVQCATASFLIRTCFCNPPSAYQALLKWAKATATTQSSKCNKRHKDLPLVIILSECDEQSLKQICVWLDNVCSSESSNNLVKCFWPN